MIFRKSRLGIMQGRLSTQVKNIIQIFPKKTGNRNLKNAITKIEKSRVDY